MKVYNEIIFNMSGEILSEDSFEYHGEVSQCMSGGGGGGDSQTTVRYAPYVEEKHTAFLTEVQTRRIAAIDDSPFASVDTFLIDDSFFGANYVMSDFPSLYDMYGKFMAGLDIDQLYTQILENSVNAPEINDLVSAEAAFMDDDINENSLPRFSLGARDINSVMSSSFVMGKASIERTRMKTLSRFSAELKYRMLTVAADRWKTHLNWNMQTVMQYAKIMQLYIASKIDIEDYNQSVEAKDTLWPFTVLEYERAALGALQGASNSNSKVAGSSDLARAVSGGLTGAAGASMMGASMTGAGLAGPLGLALGAGVGIASSFL